MTTPVRNSIAVWRDIKWGLGHGLGFAVLYSLLVAILYAIRGARAFDRYATSIGSVIALYFAAGVIAGALVGIMRPLTASRGGSILVGTVAAIPVFLGVGVLISGSITAWDDDTWVPMLLAAFILGPVLGNQQWKQARDDAATKTSDGETASP